MKKKDKEHEAKTQEMIMKAMAEYAKKNDQ